MADNRDIDHHSGVETTGHEWDGLKELNNPLPRWWVYVFWAYNSVVHRLLGGLSGLAWSNRLYPRHAQQ